VARRDLQSVVAGYPVLALSAALVFLALLLAGVSTIEEFVGNTEVETLVHPTLREMFLSASGVVAGVIMMNLIPALLDSWSADSAGDNRRGGHDRHGSRSWRARVDIWRARVGRSRRLVYRRGGGLVVLLKQALFHRRSPIV